jgi:hypothetical protein
MKIAPAIFYAIEVGSARALVRLIPLVIVVLAIAGLYNMKIYKGLSDSQSMDNAQLARQLDRKQGFNTYFIRPYAVTQYAAFLAKHGQDEVFPDSSYSSQTPRIIPDTYNSPGYPVLLAALFKVMQVDFDEPNAATTARHMFIGDRWIPLLNQVFVVLTAGLIFLFGYRVFDDRVAWMASVSFLASDFVWKFSLLAVPTSFLMLLITLLFYCAVEMYRISEVRFDEDIPSLGPVWLLIPALAVLIGVIGLTCLPLLVLLLPFVVFIMLMRKTNWAFPFLVVGIAGLMAAPWFYHWYRVIGNPLGSNMSLGLLGQGDYTGNEVYLRTNIPTYDQLFNNEGAKEYAGFLWHFQRGWDLLGSNPMVLLFAVSILHEFRRRRVQALRWLVVACAFALIAINNLAYDQPAPISAWNTVAVLFPVIVIIGSAFFFVMLDRMETQLPLFTSVIVITTLVLTVAPMLLVFTATNFSYYNYPPYIPPYISYVTRVSPLDQWVTSDIPWATAWYGDRPSLWLPDTVTDFDHFNDDVCPSSLMLLTPETTGKPMLNLTSGEQKEWLPFLLGTGMPDTFPLKGYTKLPAGGPEYVILTSHLRTR